MPFFNFTRTQTTLLSILAVASVGTAVLVPLAQAQDDPGDWFSQMDDRPGPGGPDGPMMGPPGGPGGQGGPNGGGDMRGPGGRGGPGGGPGGGMLRGLNLSAEQTQKLSQVREQFRNRMQQQRQSVETARQEMGRLMSGSASTDQLRQQHNRIQAEMQKMGDLRFESMLAMREILTPAQRQQLAQRMQERRPGRDGGPGGRDDRQGGQGQGRGRGQGGPNGPGQWGNGQGQGQGQGQPPN
ncbi:MAG: periplasmic heavy metal sensor [Oscillatoriales cyanobacterium]|nr:MAG: periplasmic heavy metal sensor [Oscillatoriales cyanobacterium]